jgi:predicted O-linked N-acetylglucosamine transferase (SPINDLY family)
MPSTDALLRSRLKRGKQLISEKRFEEARSVYQQICARRRNDPDNWLTLGVINGILKRHDDAATCCRKAAELAPGNAAAWYNLGVALRDTGQTEEAAEAFRKTLSLNPRHEGAATSLGHILVALHRYDEAEDVFRSVLDYQQGNAEFYAVYGSAMQSMGRYEAAINAYRKAIDMNHPRSIEIHENLAAALCMQGKFQDSIAASEAALRISPGNARVYSGMLLTKHYLTGRDTDNLVEEHRRWPGNTLPRTALPAHGKSETRPDRVRIGYVSSDLRRHSVAYFVEPLLAHHDAERFEVTCYFSHKDADATTNRLKNLAHRWRNVANLNDQQLLRMIADDGIDILVDLNGHTSGSRLTAFARRAAPIQVSCIGYPDTTGVTEMDYRISDAIADPAGTEHQSTEKLVRLPGCFLCYRPPDNAPDVARTPRESNGFITFGSFNNLAKVNVEVIELWASLLQEIPDSRLFIKNPSLTDASTRERYQALFESAGVSSDHLELMGFTPDSSGHLAAYGRIDIALDTFPYNGTTTSCEALWMGVPVISLRGDRHSARVGASLLSAAGHPEWIADTPEQYIQTVKQLAMDADRLTKLRFALRQQLKESRLCSAETYARAVEAAYDGMIANRH